MQVIIKSSTQVYEVFKKNLGNKALQKSFCKEISKARKKKHVFDVLNSVDDLYLLSQVNSDEIFYIISREFLEII